MKEEILILAKTYPTFSQKYFELVCTAGISKNGEWRRIYPIDFRNLEAFEKYKKYQWIEVDIAKSGTDSRPESHKLVQGTKINVLGNAPIPTKDSWAERKDILARAPLHNRLGEIISEAQRKDKSTGLYGLSLCNFKPKMIHELIITEVEREWDQSILSKIKVEKAQMNLFEDLKREIGLVKKLPYKFSYRFYDEDDREATLMISDWEIGQLYWNCLKKANGDEDIACNKVKEKYEGFLENNDVSLFLGTTYQYHSVARNPFIIAGVFYPPKDRSNRLF